MPSVETPVVSKAGITTSATGERHIPSSVRPDGSVRKEIRVRPGYRPPEDVEVYKNRTAEGFRNRTKAGIPGAEGLKSSDDLTKSGTATTKNAKRREARKKAAVAATEIKEDQNDESASRLTLELSEESNKATNPEADREKEAKKLAKKLRQARELKDKKEKGDKLLPEQFEKVIKINELIRQLETLGFDSHGDRKTET